MLLGGINHVAILTADTDRLVAFYSEVFGAAVTGTDAPPFGRLTMLHLGGCGELNIFEVEGNTEVERQDPMFGRGRIDHIGFQAASREAFDEARRRLMARGCTDGYVGDFGIGISLGFRDPDGLDCEIILPSEHPGPLKPPGTPAAGYEVGVP